MEKLYLDFVFDQHIEPEKAPQLRLVEVEDGEGKSVSVGKWSVRPDGYHVLRLDLAGEYAKLLLAKKGGVP